MSGSSKTKLFGDLHQKKTINPATTKYQRKSSDPSKDISKFWFVSVHHLHYLVDL